MLVTETLITLPKLAGTRSTADLMTAVLEQNLSGTTVTVDASALLSAAQGFADQLVKQILELRHADAMLVRSAPEHFADHLRRSAVLRQVSDRLTVQ